MQIAREGKWCRKLLRYSQKLCKNDKNFNVEELPNITDVSDSDEEEVPPIRSFRSLFQRNDSVLISGGTRIQNKVVDDVPSRFFDDVKNSQLEEAGLRKVLYFKKLLII